MFSKLSTSNNDDDVTRPPRFLRLRSSKTFIIVTVASAVFTDIFAYGIVVPVFPFALTARAGIPPARIQTWVSIFLAVYGAALLVSSPICGWFADRMESRQGSFLLGLLALGGSTAMLMAGDSVAWLAAGRVFQGVSAAVVWCTGLAVLVDTVGPGEIGGAMGYMGIAMTLAFLLAPLLGGIVLEEAGYYSVFAMAFGLIAVDVVLRFAMVERKTAKKWLPEPGSPNEETGAGPLDSEKSGATGGDSDPELSQSTTGERREGLVRRPSNAAEAVEPEEAATVLKRLVKHLPPWIFLLSSRRILAALWACMIQATLLTSFDAILPLYMKDTFGWNSIGAGLIFLPIVMASLFGPLIGRASDKYGPRWFATAGFILACPFLILLRLVDTNSLSHKVMLCAFLALLGLGLTMAITPVMAEISYAVDAKARRRPPGFFGKNGAYAQGYGLFNMAWAAGSMIGPLLAGFVQQSHGWSVTTLILGCVSAFTALPTAIWTGGSIFKRRQARKGGAVERPLSTESSV